MTPARDETRLNQTPELQIKLQFGPGETTIRTLRTLMRSMLQDHGFPESSVEGVVLGLDEALMNACEHGSSNGNGAELGLNVKLFTDRLFLEVLDRGETLGPPPDADDLLPDEEAECGRGLFLMHQVMDEVTFVPREGGGTRVQMVKRR